nr:Haloacid dehalogenase-like hydrolase (HAD) superfamily protein [Ipomoea trifida]
MHHPSPLASFNEIMKLAEGKKIVVFLDYDGTLTPIVDDPDTAVMSQEMQRTVKDLASHFSTAIVSGRVIDKLYSFESNNAWLLGHPFSKRLDMPIP